MPGSRGRRPRSCASKLRLDRRRSARFFLRALLASAHASSPSADDRRRVDLDARAHRRAERDAPHVRCPWRSTASLARARRCSACALSASLLGVERLLADAARGRCPPSRRGTRPCRPWPRVTAFVDVDRHGADLGVRHQAARTEDATELADRRPSCRASRSTRSKSMKPSWTFVDEVVGADEVGAGLARLAAPSRPWRTRARARVLPVPCGSTSAPRTIWSACLRVDAEAHREVDASRRTSRSSRS